MCRDKILCLTTAFGISLAGVFANADPLTTPLCDAGATAVQATLDNGASADVEVILAGLLDDQAGLTCISALETDAAHQWFTVLFHPAFLEALVDDGPARIGQWDKIAEVIENGFTRRPPVQS